MNNQSSPRFRHASVSPALRYRDFRLLWGGQLISLVGSEMRNIAVSWQVYQIALAERSINPALALGLLGLVRVVPLVITATFSGLVADRTDRRKLIMLTSLVALLGSAGLGLASTFGNPPLWLMYLIVALVTIAYSFEMPARQALIPNLVAPEHLTSALSLNTLIWQVASIVGPSLAGALIAVAGVAPVYWIDAVSFLSVVGAAALMRPQPDRRTREPVTLTAALEGLRFVFRQRLIASSMFLDFFATILGLPLVLLPVFADQVLGVGPVELGWMYAAPAAGAVITALLLSSVRLQRQGPKLLWAVAAYGLCAVLFSWSTWLPLSLLALAGVGASDTVSMIIRSTLRQQLTPDELRGRMVAVTMIFFAGGPRLGELSAGVLASFLGAPLAVGVGGALCVAMVALMNWRVPELRTCEG